MKEFLMPLLFFIGHMLNAISRSTDDLAELASVNGNAKKAKLFEVISHATNIFTLLFFIVGVWFSINTTPPFMGYQWYWYLIIFILTRSFYDYLRNILMGLSLDYRGSSWWDSFLKWLKMPESFMIIVRVISLILAFTFAYRFKI